MKVLLDENLPHRLRNAISTHEVFTVRFLGWSGLKNGALLSAAERDGFEVFLTGDQTISYEQNLFVRRIAVVVLSAIEWHLIRHSLPAIQSAVDAPTAGSLQKIDVGSFHRYPHIQMNRSAAGTLRQAIRLLLQKLASACGRDLGINFIHSEMVKTRVFRASPGIAQPVWSQFLFAHS